MKYISMIYEQQGGLEQLAEQEHALLIEQHHAIHAQAQQQGVYVGAAELRPPQTARSVRLQQGKALINDGPFAETKEYFIGYYLFDCASLAAACELAARIPTADGGGIELRPVDEDNHCAQAVAAPISPVIEEKSIYALLNYHPQTLLESYTDSVMDEMVASNVDMAQQAASRDDYIAGYKLLPPATATAIGGDNRNRTIFDGPFCEAKEVLLGLHLMACESLAAALDYARTLADASMGIIEVRPVNYFDQLSEPRIEWNNTD